MRRPIAFLLLAMVASLPPAAALASQHPNEAAAGAIHQAAIEVGYLSFDRALPLFEKAMTLAPQGSEDWQAALFGKATCLAQLTPATPQHIADATLAFRQIVEKYPRSKFAPQAMMALGRIDELIDYRDDKPHRESARQWYEKARAASLGTPLADEATMRIAGTFIQQMTRDDVRHGIEVLENWLAQQPKNPLASAMWQYAADSYLYPLEDYRKSLDCYLKADGIGLMERGREGPIYWRMAQLAERVADRDVAVTYYTKIINFTPTSGKAYESQLALKRLGAPVPEITIFSAAGKASSTQSAASQPSAGGKQP